MCRLRYLKLMTLPLAASISKESRAIGHTSQCHVNLVSQLVAAGHSKENREKV